MRSALYYCELVLFRVYNEQNLITVNLHIARSITWVISKVRSRSTHRRDLFLDFKPI